MRISDWSSDVCSSDLIATGTPDAKRPRLSILALLSGSTLATFATTATAAIAQQQSNPAVKLFSSTEVVVSSLVVGALGAALLSALWLVRQRGHTIGRASCRERMCKYVLIWVVAGSLKKKTKT